jgi:CHAT domain-containing protein
MWAFCRWLIGLLAVLYACGGPEFSDLRLQLGESLGRDLLPEEVHRYPLELRQGEFLHLRAQQLGMDLEIILRNPASEVVARRNAPTTTHGPEPLSWIVQDSGVHSLEIRPVPSSIRAAPYLLTLVERRPATAADSLRITAEEMFSAAGPLHWRNTRESLRQASRLYKQALQGFRALGAQSEEAYVLLNLGEVDSDLDTPYKGFEHLQEALEIFRRLGDLGGEAETLSSTAFFYTLLGEKQKALDLARRALEMRVPIGDLIGEAHSFYQIARIYQSMAEWDSARIYFQRALEVQRLAGDRAGQGFSLTALADVYEGLGREEEAFVHLDKALELHRTTRDTGATARVYSQMGSLYAATGEAEKALEAYRLALPILHSLGGRSEETLTRIRMGRAEESLGDLDAALATYRQALKMGRISYVRREQADALYGIARVLRQKGHPRESLRHIDQALDLVEELRAEVTADKLRSSFLASRRPYYEFAIDLRMELAGKEPGKGHLAAAIQISERARARSLLDILREVRTDIRQGVSPGLLQRDAKLRERLNDLAVEQERLSLEAGGTAYLAKIEGDLAELLQSYRELQAEIRAESPRYAALTQPDPLSVDAIQRQLDPSTYLLEFALGAQRSYLWAIGQDGVESFTLPGREEIENAVGAFYDLATARNRRLRFETEGEYRERVERSARELARVSESLGVMLFESLVPYLAARPAVQRLAIVGEGALQYLPFAALSWPSTVQPDFVIEHFEVVHLPSASTLAILRRELAHRPAPAGVLAVLADPVFSMQDSRMQAGLAQGDSQIRSSAAVDLPSVALRYPRLSFTGGEAAAILRLVPASKRLARIGFDASRAAMSDPGLGDFRILHFATHAVLNSEHPELSGIVLSLLDRQGRPLDGFLRLYEIYNLQLSADLVVLAACRTGLGEEVRGEGLVGLTRGFMYAGAPRVVATLWDVDDEASAELMQRFYRALLQEGERPAAALRSVQMAMAREERWREPFYWGGFVLQGEWR